MVDDLHTGMLSQAERRHVFILQVKRERLAQILNHFVQGISLRNHGYLPAFSDIGGLITLDYGVNGLSTYAGAACDVHNLLEQRVHELPGIEWQQVAGFFAHAHIAHR
jgi:hypothetical protein